MDTHQLSNQSSILNSDVRESKISKRKIGPKDVPLNVTLKEAMIRFGFMLLLPIAVLYIDKHLIIYTTPIVIYLFITGITRFCPIKRFWRRVIRHEHQFPTPPYGEDINYPDENDSKK